MSGALDDIFQSIYSSVVEAQNTIESHYLGEIVDDYFEKDGTPNHFINVTGMQRLHNGAIWQQYTEMQKMKELMYDTMVEMLGKEKADAKLKNHDVKLLENKNLLN